MMLSSVEELATCYEQIQLLLNPEHKFTNGLGRSCPEHQTIPWIYVLRVCRWVEKLFKHWVNDEAPKIGGEDFALLLFITGLSMYRIASLYLTLSW